ncbi:hypothetical protein MYX07_06210 [Patescibacteria group bacterium AH-259-L07]|nr:hypothetical protein [Patescibacteria group bacterium AH-259-L07]
MTITDEQTFWLDAKVQLTIEHLKRHKKVILKCLGKKLFERRVSNMCQNRDIVQALKLLIDCDVDHIRMWLNELIFQSAAKRAAQEVFAR